MSERTKNILLSLLLAVIGVAMVYGGVALVQENTCVCQ